MKHFIWLVFWLTACSQKDYQKFCDDFGRAVELPAKVALGECYVKCPEPTGWITFNMWNRDGRGCRSVTLEKP